MRELKSESTTPWAPETAVRSRAVADTRIGPDAGAVAGARAPATAGARAHAAPGASARIAAVAGAQWGVITQRQLERLDLSPSTITRWVASGRLYRLYAGVYAVGHPVLSTEGELVAALYFAGPGAALSHATAAWWWQLIDRAPSLTDISVPRKRRSVGRLRFHAPRDVPRTWHRRLPVTTVERTLLDYAGTAPLGQVRRALSEADYLGLLDLDAIDAVLGRGSRGTRTVRKALVDHRPDLARTDSPLEVAFLELCEAAQLPRPRVNVRVAGLKVDALWRHERVIVELDGRPGHSSFARLERDRRRDLRLRAAGFIVLRYTWRQVTEQPGLVVADLRNALSARA